jgi:hypothetical protein
MAEQNYKNHTRIVPFWHVVTSLLLIAALSGSIVVLLHSDAHNHYSAVVLSIVCIILVIFYVFIRSFALKAQDRAIRAEESLRYFILTGKPLDKQLRLGQIIALRFASDAEFPALAKKAVEQNLSGKEIKQAIQNWRPDYNRV